MSTNVKQRLKTHNLGRVKSTKAYIKWNLVHVEEFKTRIEARTREKYYKSAAGRRWRKIKLGL
ncbi:MAG: GIY-YIG nuclease family protein [Flavobacteriaceae bacterium]|nr:GIY-YIG nuclease family protein [Flavobacteriaceae bacterium]